MAVEVGKRVPDVTLVSSERKAAKLSEFLGKPTVLVFFPGAFTGVCTKELCTFRDGMTKFNEMKAQLLAISVDSPFDQKAFAATMHGVRILAKDYPGVLLDVSFDQNGDLDRESYMTQVVNGKQQVIATLPPASAK